MSPASNVDAALAAVRSDALDPRRATAEDVLALVAALEVLRDPERLRLAFACPRCRAPVGSPCVRPDGSPLVERRPRHPEGDRVRYHCPRQDRWIPVANNLSPGAWRADVADGHVAATLRAIRRSRLYRLVRRGGLS